MNPWTNPNAARSLFVRRADVGAIGDSLKLVGQVVQSAPGMLGLGGGAGIGYLVTKGAGGAVVGGIVGLGIMTVLLRAAAPV